MDVSVVHQVDDVLERRVHGDVETGQWHFATRVVGARGLVGVFFRFPVFEQGHWLEQPREAFTIHADTPEISDGDRTLQNIALVDNSKSGDILVNHLVEGIDGDVRLSARDHREAQASKVADLFVTEAAQKVHVLADH